MYYINENLVRNVYLLFGMTQKQFSEFALDSKQLYPQRLTMFNRFLVTDIIKICNATHIPIRHFFTTKQVQQPVFSKNDVVVEGTWTEVQLNMEGLTEIYRASGYEFTREELLNTLGVDSSCFWRWLNNSFTMRAQQLCDMCNEFGIDLSNIIVDKNSFIPPATKAHRDVKLQTANTRLERRIKIQEERIDQLAEAVNALVRERDMALDEVAKSKTKSRRKTYISEDHISEVAETTIEHKWGWKAKKWEGENIPTLMQFIHYCNEHKIPTTAFIATTHSPTTGNDNFTDITLDRQAYCAFAANTGVEESPEVILISKFCRYINENGLSPACCINDENSHYPTLLADRLIRIISKETH